MRSNSELAVASLGNQARWVPALFVILVLINYYFWNAGVEVGDYAVAVQEFSCVVYACCGSWMLAPQMASWVPLGVRRVRTLQAGLIAAVLASACVTPILIWASFRLVPGVPVPNGGLADWRDVPLSQVTAIAGNVGLIGSGTAVATAALGRACGAAGGLALYIATFALASNDMFSLGYQALGISTRSSLSTGWFGLTVAPIVAAAAWYRTGGTTALSRSFLDPV